MSILGRYVRQMRDREGLGGELVPVSIHMSTPSAAETAQYVLPLDMQLIAASVCVSSPGTTSGSTEIAIDNSTQSQTDLDGGQLDIAYNDTPSASDLVASSDVENGMVRYNGHAGDVYLITIDAVPTGTEAIDLNINLLFATI